MKSDNFESDLQIHFATDITVAIVLMQDSRFKTIDHKRNSERVFRAIFHGGRVRRQKMCTSFKKNGCSVGKRDDQ